MKFTSVLIAALVSGGRFAASADQVPFAIVHGPKAAFNIAAPEGWVIDNSAGAANGLPCVLYRKGETWETADPLMYAKIASTSIEDAEAFARKAIEEMKKDRGEFKMTRIASGKTKDRQAWFTNEYGPNEQYPRWERVAYVQMSKAVAYFVHSGDREEVFRKNQPALQKVVDSFNALEVKGEKSK